MIYHHEVVPNGQLHFPIFVSVFGLFWALRNSSCFSCYYEVILLLKHLERDVYFSAFSVWSVGLIDSFSQLVQCQRLIWAGYACCVGSRVKCPSPRNHRLRVTLQDDSAIYAPIPGLDIRSEWPCLVSCELQTLLFLTWLCSIMVKTWCRGIQDVRWKGVLS